MGRFPPWPLRNFEVLPLASRSLTLDVTFPPVDNPDWDHARTRRLALRAPEVEWTQSSVTERWEDGFLYLRNDHSYEGLLGLVHEEDWKFLDRLGFQVRVGGTPVDWEPTAVSASPERVVYAYSGTAGQLNVAYTLVEQPAGAALIVQFELLDPSGEGEVTLAVKPVLDIRHMYEPSAPKRHKVRHKEAYRFTVSNHQHWLGIGADRDFEFHPGQEVVDLRYALGHGEREWTDGQVRFKAESHKGFVPGELEFPLDGPVAVAFLPGEDEETVMVGLDELTEVYKERMAEQDTRLKSYFERFTRVAPEVVHRVYAMAEKFGMPVEETRVPEAGGWWFRTPWFRSAFEGYMHNHRTLVALGKGETIEANIRLALKYQDPVSGRLPNRPPRKKDDQERWTRFGRLPADYYPDMESALFLFAFLEEFLPTAQDPELPEAVWKAFQGVLAGMRKSRISDRQGNPVLLEHGLLLSVPHHAWIDGKRTVWAEGITVTDLPIRVPMNWQLQDVLQLRDSHYTWDNYQYPTYYLPEINAYWLKALELAEGLAERFGTTDEADEVREIRASAIARYKGIFWNPQARSLYNLVTLEHRQDGTHCAAAVEAAALLGEAVFTRQELEYIWVAARGKLLAKRHLAGESVAFGLVAKDSTERVFYNNQQYHEAVIWPRVTPYLIRLLRGLGQQATVQELLKTNLGHQMDEAVVFYNSEMLSLPEGENPFPNPDTAKNPVPVKNPIQWWSQWCDPYMGVEGIH